MKRNLITAALLTSFAGTAMAAGDPSGLPDQASVVLSGTAVETTPSTFLLDYGKGTLTVEMDDWNWVDEEARGLIEGDKVTVYGRIDDGFAEARTIEASSLYIESLGTYFEASPSDEEEYPLARSLVLDVDGNTDVTGRVTSVSPMEEEFTIDSGARQVTVDTSSMTYDVLDDKGFQQVEKGDLVAVDGTMDDDLLESMELMAESVVTYSQGY